MGVGRVGGNLSSGHTRDDGGFEIQRSYQIQQKIQRWDQELLAWTWSMRAKEVREILWFLNMNNGVDRGVIFKEEKRADLV